MIQKAGGRNYNYFLHQIFALIIKMLFESILKLVNVYFNLQDIQKSKKRKSAIDTLRKEISDHIKLSVKTTNEQQKSGRQK